MSDTGGPELLARAATLRQEIGTHNAAIRKHRKLRASLVEQLAALERKCRARGIGFILVPQHSEGAVHGDTESRSRSDP